MKCVCVEVSFEKFGSHTSFFIFIKSSRICISPKLMINLLLFSHSVTSNSLQPHELHHARLPCPSLSPGVCSTHRHWVRDAIQPSYPLFSLLLLPSVFPSIRVFSNELTRHIGWPKSWTFSFSISPSDIFSPIEYSGLISFRIDLFDHAVQGTLRSLLQHHSSKASVLWCSAFFMIHTWLLEKSLFWLFRTFSANWCSSYA